MKNKFNCNFTFQRQAAGVITAFCLLFVLLSGLTIKLPIGGVLTGDRASKDNFSLAPRAEANNTYFNLANGNLTLNLTNQTTNLISSNNDWTAIASVEG